MSSSSYFNDDQQEPFTDRFSLESGKPIELIIHNPRGEITVRGVNRDDILLRSEVLGPDDGGEASLDIQHHDNRMEVRADAPGSTAGRVSRHLFRRLERQARKAPASGSWQIDFDDFERKELRALRSRGGRAHDIEIEVPISGFEVRVEAHTASGEITIEDVHGAVDAATASGDISLRRVSGDLTVQTASGDIDVAEATGSLRARSASGDLHVADATLEQYVVNTASGEVDVTTTLIGGGPYRVDSVSGDIRLTLEVPERLLAKGFTIPYKTVSGDGQVTGPVRKVNRRTWRLGPDDANGLELPVRTVSGDMWVSLTTQASHGTPAVFADDATIPLPPAPPRPPTPPAILTDTVAGAGDADAERDAPDAARHAIQEADKAVRHADALTRIADEMAAGIERDIAQAFKAPHVPPVPPVPRVPKIPPVPPILPIPKVPGFAGTAPVTPTSPTPETPASSAATPDERLAILSALEQGEIEIDEAMRRLDDLPSSP